MTEPNGLPLGEEIPEVPPRPRRWWVGGLVLLLVGAVLATFIPGLLPRESTGSGSGFVVSPGYVLTAAHVVRGAREIVVYGGGRRYRALTVAENPDLDLALLRVEGGLSLPAAPLAVDLPWPGEEVAAVGHPAGAVQPLVLSTRVAGTGLSVVSDGTLLRDLIATTDPFSPGYSGSPLVNAAGQVVGVVLGRLSSRDGFGPGLGYALSAHRAAEWLTAQGGAFSLVYDRPSGPLREAEILTQVGPAVVRVEARLPPGRR